MFLSVRKILLFTLLTVLVVNLTPSGASALVWPTEDGLRFELVCNTDSVYERLSTSDPSQEIAEFTFNVMYGYEGLGTVPTGNIDAMTCKIHFDHMLLKLVDVVPDTTNWETIWSFDTVQNYGTVTLQFSQGDAPAPDALTPFAKLYFTPECQMEGSWNSVTLDTSTEVAWVAIDGVYRTPTTFGDDSVRVADYWAEFTIPNETYTALPGTELEVPILGSGNCKLGAISHKIEYDSDKLHFLGLGDDYDSIWTCENLSDSCPAIGDDPVDLLLLVVDTGAWHFAGVELDTIPTEIYSLKFEVLSDSGLWDGDSSAIEFVEDSCITYGFAATQWCIQLLYDSNSVAYNDGAVHLEEYSAFFEAVLDSNTIGPNNSDKVWYTVNMNNRFDAGMPASCTGDQDNITFVLNLAEDLDYELMDDSYGIEFDRTDDSPAKAPPMSGLSLTEHFLTMYQVCSTGVSNHRAMTTDTSAIVGLQFEYMSTIDSYDERFIDFDFTAINTTSNDTAQVQDTAGLVTATYANGRLTWYAEPLEVSVGEFHAVSGSGATPARELYIRHNFDLYDFSIKATVGLYHYIDSIVCEPGVLAVQDTSCTSGYDCWTIYADDTSWVATDTSWRQAAMIFYHCNVSVPCDQSRSSDVVFSDYYVKDIDDVSRYVWADTATIVTSGPSCPRPSCPVLFSHNGERYVQENPLLTACEATNYTEAVTDYYMVSSAVPGENGRVNFQLREMEDEITYLESVELLTVDHPKGRTVACAEDGTIFMYDEVNQPLSAVDHHGVDRLEELLARDDKYFVSNEPGYLIVTFPATKGAISGFALESVPKAECPAWPPRDNDDQLEKVNPGDEDYLALMRIETLDEAGNWVEAAAPPPRSENITEVVMTDPAVSGRQNVVTLKVSWTTRYSADVFSQFVPSQDEPKVVTHQISDYEVASSTGAAKMWGGFDAESMLTLTRDEVIDFSFDCGEIETPDTEREYIIRAVGRYVPDYSVYTNLVPGQFALHDAYPNPFNPSTKISYDLPVATDVRVEVFNLLGQRVATLVDEYQEAGQHTVEWDSKNGSGETVASGMYFYRMTTDTFTQSKKMVLLK